MGDLGWETETDASSMAGGAGEDDSSGDDDFDDAAEAEGSAAASEAQQARMQRQMQLSSEAGGEAGSGDGAGARATGVLGATVGASTTLYVAPQAVRQAAVARSGSAAAESASSQESFPRARGPETETYLVEHLEQPDAEGNLMVSTVPALARILGVCGNPALGV